MATKVVVVRNSFYGSLLNEFMKFYDKRIGQSTTLTGRSIVRHMNAKLNEIATGEYDYLGKVCRYADTDSAYFSVDHMFDNDNPPTTEEIIQMYDNMAEETNETFPAFMNDSFNTGMERGSIIRAGRELVGRSALFIKKKKYAILVVDLEGHRQDVNGKPGKLKIMGLDLKRADTPMFMQEFLEKVLMDTLVNEPTNDIFGKIVRFREEFRDRPGWEKGTPKKVNGLTDYTKRELEAADVSGDIIKKRKTGTKSKVNMPGHVRASINWNRLREINEDMFSMEITDGQKVIVCKLKPNPTGMTSVAYPIDQVVLPDWFKELPFDDATMEKTIIDMKLENLLGVLGWDLTLTNADVVNDDLFTW